MNTPISIKEERCIKHESDADVSQDHLADHLIGLAVIKQERAKDENSIMDIESELCQEFTFKENLEDINVKAVEEVIIKNESFDGVSMDTCYDNRNFSTKSNTEIGVEDKQFECHLCKYCCLTRHHLTQHMRQHTRMESFDCERCNRKYSTKGDLGRHMRTHPGEKPYACNICHKRFSTCSALHRHMNLHIGEKPSECDICKKKFSARSSYLNHKKRRHTGKELVQIRKSDKMGSTIIEEIFIKSEMACELFDNSTEGASDGDPIFIDIKQKPFNVELNQKARITTAKSNYKCCFVPGCRNTSYATPNKIFISVPGTEKIRIAWLKAANRNPKSISKNTRLNCCEDHFNLEEDMESYLRFKMMGGKILLKKNVVPHLFDCQGRMRATSKPPRSAYVKRCRRELVESAINSYISAATTPHSTAD